MKRTHRIYADTNARGGWLSRLALLTAFAVMTAGCTNQAVTANPLEVPAPATNIAASITQATQSMLWLTAKSGPYWSLLSLNPAKRIFSDITPTGISSRGGFAVAANGNGVGAVAFYPYVSMVDSPVFITTNQAESWRTFQLEAGIADLAHPIALSSDRLYVLVNIGGRQVLRSTTFSGRDQRSINTPSQRILSIFGDSSGLVALVGHNRGSSLFSYDETSRSWSFIASIPSPSSATLDINTVIVGTSPSTSSQDVAACYLGEHRPSKLDEILVSNSVVNRTSTSLPYPSPVLIGCGLDGGSYWYAALKSSHSYRFIARLTDTNQIVVDSPEIPLSSDFVVASSRVFAYHYSGWTLHLIQLSDGADFGPKIDSYLGTLFDKLSSGA